MSQVMGTSEDRSRQRARLTRTIQAEIIPRLMLAHRIPPAESRMAEPGPGEPHVLPYNTSEFARELLSGDSAAAIARVAQLRMNGVSVESIFLELLAPAAREMGALWKSDDATFTAVTIGLTHLQQMVRQLSPAFTAERPGRNRTDRAVLAAAPGEQHVFGLLVLEEFFRRAGWDVLGAADAAGCDLVELVRDEPIALIGFSIADSRAIPALTTLIGRVREASSNPDLLVLVGGNCVVQDPSVLARVGGDATAQTPAAVLELAERHVERITARPGKR